MKNTKNNIEKEDLNSDIGKLIVWAFKGSKTKQDIASELAEMGFSVAKISMYLNTPSNAISAALINSRNKKTKK